MAVHRALALALVLSLGAFSSTLASKLGPQCTKPGAPWKGAPKGSEVSLGGLPSYVAGTPSGNQEAAIMLITDVFGWAAPNNRIAADLIAERSSIPVYVPDFFQGDALTNVSEIGAFLGRHGPAQTVPLLNAVVADLKSQYGEDLKVGAIGTCWGGRYSLILNAEGKADAVVACHPSLVNVTEDNLAASTAPTLFEIAANDTLFDPALQAETFAAMRGGGALLVVKVFEGVQHGFCVRCAEGDTVCEKARYEALSLASAWFAGFLKAGSKAADVAGYMKSLMGA